MYETSPFYRLREFNDVIGLLVVGISPTSQIGIIGRVIGYTGSNTLYAHPLWHQLKSRKCNGSSDSITLLLDVLVNFSRDYLPASHGGSMDTPTILNLVDNWKDLLTYSKLIFIRQNQFFYSNLGKKSLESKVLSYEIAQINQIPLDQHITNDISEVILENKLRDKKIFDRIQIALNSLKTIRAVEEEVFVDNILINDFLSKINSSIVRFFKQPIRCRNCRRTFRRVPLSMNCPFCHKKTLELTLSKGWVLRYMETISQLADQYSELSELTKSWIKYIELNKDLLLDIGPKPTTLFSNQDSA